MKDSIDYYNRSRPELSKHIPINTKKVLDIGCGQGSFLQLVKERTGAETWGIEIITEVAELAKNVVDNILVGKIEDLINLIPQNYFDCITFNDVLEHLVEPEEILKLTKSKLSENGIVLASIPNVRFIKNLYELLIERDWEYKESGILDSTHLRFFTQKSMCRLFKNAGYQVISIEGINGLNSMKFKIINLFSLGNLSDTKFSQVICIAK